jgi:phosphomannomutase
MKVHHIRDKFIETLQREFSTLNLHYTTGGQISFDVSFKGWNKSYCLKFLSGYQEIYFFGDKTEKVSNKKDY